MQPVDTDRSCGRHWTLSTGTQSSYKYDWGEAVEALPISDSSLKNNSLSPSQWRTGVTWSRRRAPNTRRAAVFCSDCRRFISASAVPVNMAFFEQLKLVNKQDFYYDSLYVNTHVTCWA